MRSATQTLVLAALLCVSLGCNFVTSIGRSDAPASCYEVTFLGFTEGPDGASAWRYSVEELACAQDLSNWMLEIPACASVVSASPSPWEIVQPDPNFHFDGIKWQTGAGFQSGEFSVTLTGGLTSGMVKYGVKGPDVAIGLVEGPVCDLTTSTPNGDPTTTLTPTLEAVPSSTAPAPTSQPPASSGVILVTDNNQVLTFTCNGNAVEIRGNANTVTLLGSCGSITVKGNENQVFWQSGSPVITNTGNGNVIIQK